MALSKIDSDGIVSGGITADSLNIGQIGGRRNLIINGAMQVAQRGTSFTATGGSFQYGWVDRWKTSYEVNATYSQVDADVDGYGGKATRIAPTGASTQYAFQVIENPRSIASKKFTVSWWAKASGTFAQYIYVRRGGGGDLYFDPSFTNVTTDWQRFSVTVTGLETTALADGANLDILIGFTSTGSSDTYDLTMVQVEEGTVATPFEHISYGEQLALCQRYYYRINGRRVLGTGNMYGADQFYGNIVFPVEMRDVITLSWADGSNYYRCYSGSATLYSSGLSGTQSNYNGGNSTGFYISFGGSLTRGDGAWIQIMDDNAWVDFSAEL